MNLKERQIGKKTEKGYERRCIHCKKKLATFPSPTGMSITKLFPPRESLVSDIPAGGGKTGNLFLQCKKGGVLKKSGKDLEWVKRGEGRINLNTFFYQGKIPGIFCPKHFQWGSNTL